MLMMLFFVGHGKGGCCREGGAEWRALSVSEGCLRRPLHSPPAIKKSLGTSTLGRCSIDNFQAHETPGDS